MQSMRHDPLTASLFPDDATQALSTQSLWVACCELLAQELPQQQFNTWIKPLTATVAEDFSKVTLQVANRFKLDWIRAQYAGRIAAALHQLLGQDVGLELVVAARGMAAGLAAAHHNTAVRTTAAQRALRAQPRPKSLNEVSGVPAPRPAQSPTQTQPYDTQRVPAPSAAQSFPAPTPMPRAATDVADDSPATAAQRSSRARVTRSTRSVARAAAHAGSPSGAAVSQAEALNQPPAPQRSAPFPPSAMPHAAASRDSSNTAQPQHPQPRTRLNPGLTFGTLIEGSANRMARAAAMHVADEPGRMYNPLFIYGGVGLGKTHIMQAIGHRMLAQQPQSRVLYIHAEQFLTDVVQATKNHAFDELRQRYHGLDLLLVDDVQFIAGKPGTQDQFFSIFEALLNRGSHIVMTSDTYPKGLANINERLISRFDAGLTVAIEPPELDMRVAILRDKATAEKTDLPQEVAFFIAQNLCANVRELEGALRKVLAFARFNQREVSIDVARDALRDLLNIQNRQITVENIQKTVADFYRIKIADMHSKKRPVYIARPRQIAMYLSKELTKKSFPEIGELFGGRDHTTIMHAVRKITKERLDNAELSQQLHMLEQSIRG